jgi:hypothetical protein
MAHGIIITSLSKKPYIKISFAEQSEKITTFALLKVGHKAKPKNAKKKLNFKNLLQQR